MNDDLSNDPDFRDWCTSVKDELVRKRLMATLERYMDDDDHGDD